MRAEWFRREGCGELWRRMIGYHAVITAQPWCVLFFFFIDSLKSWTWMEQSLCGLEVGMTSVHNPICHIDHNHGGSPRAEAAPRCRPTIISLTFTIVNGSLAVPMKKIHILHIGNSFVETFFSLKSNWRKHYERVGVYLAGSTPSWLKHQV